MSENIMSYTNIITIYTMLVKIIFSFLFTIAPLFIIY